MPTSDKMRSVLAQYLKCVAEQDVDGIVDLFATGVSVEDPVGGGPGTHVQGRSAVEEFFRKGFARNHPEPTPRGPIVTTAGNEAAMAFSLRLDLRAGPREFDVIDVMKFDTEGKIISLRAFWNFAEGNSAIE